MSIKEDAKINTKYFMSSDGGLIINIEKIDLIQLVVYNKDIYSKTATASVNGEEYDVVNSNIDLERAVFKVNINGIETPVTLKYDDGIMLINLLSSDSGGHIFYNAYKSVNDGNTYILNASNQTLSNTYGYIQVIDSDDLNKHINETLYTKSDSSYIKADEPIDTTNPTQYYYQQNIDISTDSDKEYVNVFQYPTLLSNQFVMSLDNIEWLDEDNISPYNNRIVVQD
jgi:hypothetical protein